MLIFYIYMTPLYECCNCTSLTRLIHECTDRRSIILQFSFAMLCLRLILCGFMDSKLTNFTYIFVWSLMFYICLMQTKWVLQSYAFDQDKKSIHVLPIHKGYYTVWSQVFITYCVVCKGCEVTIQTQHSESTSPTVLFERQHFDELYVYFQMFVLILY